MAICLTCNLEQPNYAPHRSQRDCSIALVASQDGIRNVLLKLQRDLIVESDHCSANVLNSRYVLCGHPLPCPAHTMKG